MILNKALKIFIASCLLFGALSLASCGEDKTLPNDNPNTENNGGNTGDEGGDNGGNEGNEGDNEGGNNGGNEGGENEGGENEGGEGDNPTPTPPVEWGDERAYVFDMESLPEIHISVPLDEWNRLLDEYDRDPNTAEYIHCDTKIWLKGTTYTIKDAGLRLRGNTSRRRPEAGNSHHVANKADWQHCHFMLNLRKYVKDDEHSLRGVRKIHLKWFKDDPAYCREIYSYDLFRRFGVWTAAESSYCRLWVHVEGDTNEAYYGVYGMYEPIDDRFLKWRKDKFENHKGYLWKCAWGASLNYDRDRNCNIGYDDGYDHVYELKEAEESDLPNAKAQLLHFMKQLRDLQGTALHDWLGQTIDIELLLRTYATNVVLGMWDDYWNNMNNYYIYFNSTDTSNYKFYFLPYDYDNTLGTSNNCGVQSDAARHDPLNWGDTNTSPLIGKILQFSDYRKIYVDALNELCASSGPFYYTTSIARIKQWHALIGNYIDNDTGEDTRIKDRPASWGNHYEYRLWEVTEASGSYPNYFRVKAASIPKQ